MITEKLNYGTSYILGQWSTSENNNLAGKIRYLLNQLPFYLYFFIFFFITKNNYKGDSSILYWVILLCLSLSFSTTLLVRYSLIPTFILLFLILTTNKKSILLYAFLFAFSILYFSIDTLYGYRRQLELGVMWEALYTPPFVKISTLSGDYKSMLSEVDSDGFWIYNKINLD